MSAVCSSVGSPVCDREIPRAIHLLLSQGSTSPATTLNNGCGFGAFRSRST
jgi:hypothetical protein